MTTAAAENKQALDPNGLPPNLYLDEQPVPEEGKDPEPQKEPEAPEPEKAKEQAGKDDEEALDPASPMGKLLQREQMKRANFEKETIARIEAMEKSLLAAIQNQGGKATKAQQDALDQLEEAQEGLENQEDDDPDSFVRRGDIKKLEESVLAKAAQTFQEQRQLESRRLEAEKEWVADFEKANPTFAGKGDQVLDRYHEYLERFPSRERLTKAEQANLEQLAFQHALNLKPAEEKKQQQPEKSKPSKRSPEGADVIKQGAQAGGGKNPPGSTEIDEYGLPKGLYVESE